MKNWGPVVAVALGVIVSVFVYSAIFGHYQHPPAGYFFSGAIQDDQPYYMVLSRAVFWDGNGLFYANPFSLVQNQFYYSHLFIVLVAWAQRLVGAPTDVVFQAAGAVAVVAMYACLWYLVRAVVADEKARIPVFILCGTAGSIGWVFALLFWLLHRAPDPDFARSAMHFVYENGQWLDSLFSNAIYPTESFYHALMLLALGSLALRRFKLTAVFALLTWWAHAFYGLELSVIAFLYGLLDAVAYRKVWRTRSPEDLKQLLFDYLPIFAAILVGALYYLVYLPTIPEHKAVTQHWQSYAYKITLKYYPVHYHIFGLIPIVVLALSRSARTWLLNTAEGIFCLAFTLGVFLMMNHNWFIQSTQPAHFARGYLLLALILLTWGLVANSDLNKLRKVFTSSAVLLALSALLVIDNVLIVYNIVYRPDPAIAWLPTCITSFADVLEKDATHPLLVATHGFRMDTLYLMRKAHIRAFYSHPAGPDYEAHLAEGIRFFGGNDAAFDARYKPTYAVASDAESETFSKASYFGDWSHLADCNGLHLFKRSKP